MTNDLKFSGDLPVVINYNGSPDDIYAPVRTSSCDITVVSPQILDDLYTAKKDEICVRIKRGEETIWEGYKMPNTYSQEVSLNLDSITMTCIDPVSILKFVTIDKLFDKPRIVYFSDLIGKALAYVKIDADTLWTERSVYYGNSSQMSSGCGVLDYSIQVSNFWDESERPSTVYEVIEEFLRPFCLTFVYYNNSYQIYNPNRTTGTRTFDVWKFDDSGHFTRYGSAVSEIKASGLYDFNNGDWKSNNTQTPNIEIDSTYDKVTGVASTSIPAYSRMITDLMNYTKRDKYSYDDLNVQRNKTKGYVKDVRNIVIDPTHAHSTVVIEPILGDRWFYIWNGVYCDAEYELTDAGLYTDWYNTCNKAYYYLTGNAGHPDNWGAALTFFGGSDNPNATGKSQNSERSVKIKDRITAYVADNGVPPEFLETADLAWTYGITQGTSILTKSNPSNSKFGVGIAQSNNRRVVYHQTYENVCLSLDDKTVDIDLTQSYSRTGIDVPVNVMSNNTTTNKTYNGSGTNRTLATCNTDYFPPQWNATAVTVDSYYFRRYSTSGTGGQSCRPVWDERLVNIYIKLSNGTYKQFDGKNWIDDDGNHSRGFILTKLMNGEHLYHNGLKYDMIRTSADTVYQGQAPIRYYLGTEEKKIYLDNNGGVVDEDDATDYILCRPYMKEDSAWYTWIADCSEGHLSIKLPYIADAGATVYVDVYNSNLLGMTGNDGSVTGAVVDHYFPFYYTLSDTTETTPDFKEVEECYANFLPANVSHVKAEHLDLNVSISVPESNLGQMFQESDIKYELDSDNDYIEEFEGPSFLVNTFNPLVASSFSYIIYDNAYADPGQFVINGQAGRPEAYTVQAYFNWLSKIRKIYTKTLIPYPNYVRTRPFSNVRCYLKSPEVGTNELLVVRDTWDVKTDRHTVTAVEDQDLEVGVVSTVDVIEIPRMARAERYNLPTAHK